MNLLTIILQFAGATMLLLYSVRLVRTGVERASGPALRRVLADPRRGRFASAAIGLLVAVALQSSTATAMLAAGFAASGLVAATAGLALLLGADVGTALVVQFLSFELQWLISLLLAVGGWLFLKFDSRTAKQAGRICIGVAFILISLGMIGEATEPLKESRFMPQVAGYLANDFVTAFLVAAVVTFLLHSSVAAVLMIMQFVSQGVLPVEAGFYLLLGANAGGAWIPVWLTRSYDRAGRKLPYGNLLFRSAGAVAVLALSQFVMIPFDEFGGGAARQIANLHLAFNLALLVLCLPLVGLVERLVERLAPRRPEPDAILADLQPKSALDRSVIGQPRLALASATREILRMAGIVEVMMRPVMDLFEKESRDEVDRLRKLDKQVNEAHTAIKLYIAEVNRGELSAAQAERGLELTSFAINLERAGDIVAKMLLELVEDLHKHKLSFSKEGWRELREMHARVMANMQMALNVLVSEDIESARLLITEKDRMRTIERESHNRHLVRLKAGTVESIDTSDIHLETVRSLREINSLYAAVALPILARNGQLRQTRLMKVKTHK